MFKEKIFNDKIFVSLVAFMDDELPKTVEDIFKKAKNPKNITIGIYNQDTIDYKYNGKYNVKVVNIHPKASKGYCWCRNKLNSELITDEKYYCQIAPHSRCKENWDEFMIKALKTKGKKSILCGRPINYFHNGRLGDDNLTYSKPRNFDQNLVVSLEKTKARPFQEVEYMQAGAIFTYIEWAQEIPYDPYIFIWGEEPDISMRTYLAGWKMYIPPSMQFYHLYGQKLRRGHSRNYVNYDHLNGLGKLRVKIKLGLEKKGMWPEAEKGFDFWYIDGSEYLDVLKRCMSYRNRI